MRFMIIRKADPQTEAWEKPSRALVDAMMAYNEEMIRAGVMLGGDGLKPSSRFPRSKRIRSAWMRRQRSRSTTPPATSAAMLRGRRSTLASVGK